MNAADARLGAAAPRMRIAKAMAHMGYRSRRRSEESVLAGRVAVNGVVVVDPSVSVAPGRDTITVDGKPLAPIVEYEYYAVNKPPGFISTVTDPHADWRVVDLVRSRARLYPVGRLDKDSEGLILLTNDGGFANRISHPSYQVEKEYAALVQPTPTNIMIDRLRQGVVLNGRRAVPVRVALRITNGEAWVRLVLHEGRKHEVRELLGEVHLEVRRLIRTRIGSFLLGSLKAGEHRKLKPSEVNEFLRSDGRSRSVSKREASR
ncbi:MAG: rRNA pseudouridine synthase [Chloroflexi bacterium]|nr:rRNA pseudouridine synthase [Chloroflexota bacterium]